VKAEQGHLDILVNNATAVGPDPFAPPAVLEQEPDDLRAVYGWFTIGVHCELLCGTSLDRGRWGACGECFPLWSRLLPPGSGLRATKAGLDKLTFDMAQDFKPYNVAVVSIWPGPDSNGEVQVRYREDPWG